MTKRAPRKMLHEFLELSPPLKVDNSKVKKVTELTGELLKQLFMEEVCAIHVPNYFPSGLAKKAGNKILEMTKVKNYTLPVENNEKVKTDVNYGLGFPKRLAYASDKGIKRYYREALGSTRKMRGAFDPQLSPLDLLRLELDELWGAGASLSHNNGRVELAGTIRHMHPTPQGLAHVDDYFRTKNRRAFSACLYLEVPKTGGELEVWNVALTSENRRNPLFKVVNTFDEATQEIIRKRYPSPFKVKPKAGDLIIFDAGRPHAVAGFSKGYRLVIQTFILFQGQNEPLKIFS